MRAIVIDRAAPDVLVPVLGRVEDNGTDPLPDGTVPGAESARIVVDAAEEILRCAVIRRVLRR